MIYNLNNTSIFLKNGTVKKLFTIIDILKKEKSLPIISKIQSIKLKEHLSVQFKYLKYYVN